MTISESVYALLATLAVGGAWESVADLGTPTPYIRYTIVVAIPNNSLQGASDLHNSRVQIDCYDKLMIDAQALSSLVQAAMKAAGFTNICLSIQQFYEPDTRLRRVMLDYSVWSS